MKVVYVVEWDAFRTSGVVRKVVSQFEAWNNQGVEAFLVLVSPVHGANTLPVVEGENVSIVGYRSYPGGLHKVAKAIALRRARNLCQRLRPDLIYYRQSSWTPGILALLSCAQRRVIEVNSNDLAEAHQYGALRAYYHLATRWLLINAVDGFVGVSREITELYKTYGKPVVCIGNGFETTRITPRPVPHNLRPQLIFVGSPGQAWHGVDKLLGIADYFADMDFHIVGIDLPSPPANFFVHGFLGGEELAKLYATIDCGFGSLALHRKKMEEASPLKSREYLAYGIPVIGAYLDTDVDGAEFFLRLPNAETGVIDSVDFIRKFILTWKDKAIDMEAVRSRIDVAKKEGRRLDFMRALVGRTS